MDFRMRYRSDVWRDVARHVDCQEKVALLRFLAATDPMLHHSWALRRFTCGDRFLLEDVLGQLRVAGLVRRFALTDGDYYALAPIPGLVEKIGFLEEYLERSPGRHG